MRRSTALFSCEMDALLLNKHSEADTRSQRLVSTSMFPAVHALCTTSALRAMTSQSIVTMIPCWSFLVCLLPGYLVCFVFLFDLLEEFPDECQRCQGVVSWLSHCMNFSSSLLPAFMGGVLSFLAPFPPPIIKGTAAIVPSVNIAS
jgi:hypothetical protein